VALAALTAQVIAFEGKIAHAPSKPDCTHKKLIDRAKLKAFGRRAPHRP
jgi:hypothetical protein